MDEFHSREMFPCFIRDGVKIAEDEIGCDARYITVFSAPVSGNDYIGAFNAYIAAAERVTSPLAMMAMIVSLKSIDGSDVCMSILPFIPEE